MKVNLFFIVTLLVITFAIVNAKKCGPNEQWKECASACEPTCGKEDMMCIMSCQPPACQCKEGTARNKQGKCVPRSKC